MRRLDIAVRAGKSLSQAKARTLLTSLAIAVGAFTLTLALAAGEGARQYSEKVISSNVDPQSVSVAKDPDLFFTSGAPSGLAEYSENQTTAYGMKVDTLTSSDIDKIKATAHVERVVPMYQVSAQYVTFEKKPNSKYTSDVSVYDASVLPDAAEGTLPPKGQQIADDEIVVPEAYVEKLGLKNKPGFVGSQVTLHLVKTPAQLTDAQTRDILQRQGTAGLEAALKPETKDVTYKVRTVSKASSTSVSASQGLYISQNQAQTLTDWLNAGTKNEGQYIAATVSVAKGTDPATVKAALKKLGYEAQTAEDLQSFIFQAVNVLQSVVIGFSVLALIASLFGIINTMYISVLERIRQIGLMKALGMSGRDVAKLFRYEAAWIGALGGAIGAGLAWGAGTILNPYITEWTKLGEGNTLLIFQSWVIAAIIVGLMVVAVIAGYLPARKAAKLDPIEALRTE